MKRAIVILAGLSLAVACTEKKTEAPVATTPPPSAAAPTPAAPPAIVALDCEKVIPEALRTKFGLTDPEVKPATGLTGANCNFMKDGRPVTVGVLCPTWGVDTFRKTMETGRESAQKGQDFKDLSGVGRMGYMSTRGPGIVIAQVWDDDTMCYATVSGTDAAMTEELSQEFVKNVNPALLGR